MNNIEALDTIFSYFLSNEILEKLKKDGFYSPIINKEINCAAEIYDYITDEQSAFQDTNYTWLANELNKFLNKGSVLQIGCGRGDLLLRLSNLNYGPIYGIDRSQSMIKAANEKLKNLSNYYLIKTKVENFKFNILLGINNIIINNFWSLLSQEAAKNLLNNLKECLDKDSLVFIGPYYENGKDKIIIEAENILKKNLGFTFSYDFFKDFESCGYKAKEISLAGLSYFKLCLK